MFQFIDMFCTRANLQSGRSVHLVKKERPQFEFSKTFPFSPRRVHLPRVAIRLFRHSVKDPIKELDCGTGSSKSAYFLSSWTFIATKRTINGGELTQGLEQGSRVMGFAKAIFNRYPTFWAFFSIFALAIVFEAIYALAFTAQSASDVGIETIGAIIGGAAGLAIMLKLASLWSERTPSNEE